MRRSTWMINCRNVQEFYSNCLSSGSFVYRTDAYILYRNALAARNEMNKFPIHDKSVCILEIFFFHSWLKFNWRNETNSARLPFHVFSISIGARTICIRLELVYARRFCRGYAKYRFFSLILLNIKIRKRFMQNDEETKKKLRIKKKNELESSSIC